MVNIIASGVLVLPILRIDSFTMDAWRMIPGMVYTSGGDAGILNPMGVAVKVSEVSFLIGGQSRLAEVYQ